MFYDNVLATPNEDICSELAKLGNLEFLKSIRKLGRPWDERTCYNACKYGNFNILVWAYNNGCPWDKKKCWTVAIKNKNFDIALWISDQ